VSIRPFRIAVPQTDLDDLADRLARTRWPDQPPEAGWEYGIPAGYLRGLAEYWRTGYDWRTQEARLNELPQFTTEIDGQNVHFVHVRSPDPHALPLILTHSWPGSIVEFLDVIGPLADTFHVVVPSIPGFGFTGPTHRTGWTMARVALAWAELMRRLGYHRYVAHGGDFGAMITRELGIVDREHVAAVHVTHIFSASARDHVSERYRSELSGYAKLQATRPHSLAYGLTDSPVGQLAWIAERFKDWTDSKDVPEDAVDRDALLTNVMLYWLTGTAGSSARYYKDSAGWPEQPSTVPTNVAVFPHDIAIPVREVAERTHNIVRWTEFDRGGHFAAMEEPDLIVEDLLESFEPYR
jgi:pimeloyl-ACP methyl ester carboxylesterase